jgi:hypothetical protein
VLKELRIDLGRRFGQGGGPDVEGADPEAAWDGAPSLPELATWVCDAVKAVDGIETAMIQLAVVGNVIPDYFAWKDGVSAPGARVQQVEKWCVRVGKEGERLARFDGVAS